jgi:hypothetical protein
MKTATTTPEAQFEPKIYCTFTKMVSIAELLKLQHPLNPKRHPEEQVAAFKEIIRHNGIRRPITVSKLSGKIVAGHGLLQALEQLKAQHAPVDYQDFKDEAHELAHMMADNKLAEYGITDEAQLKAVVKQIEDGGLDVAFDLMNPRRPGEWFTGFYFFKVRGIKAANSCACRLRSHPFIVQNDLDIDSSQVPAVERNANLERNEWWQYRICHRLDSERIKREEKRKEGQPF